MKTRSPELDPSWPAGGSDAEIITLPQAAEYMHCHPTTLYRLLRRGQFPEFHLGGDWRFRRVDIENWVKEQTIVAVLEARVARELSWRRIAEIVAERLTRRGRVNVLTAPPAHSILHHRYFNRSLTS